MALQRRQFQGCHLQLACLQLSANVQVCVKGYGTPLVRQRARVQTQWEI